MKKCTAIVLVLSLALALFACGGAAAPDPDYDAAQDFACRYITVCADRFYDPPSMQVVKAWYYKNGAMWYFTFELKVENNYHITQTVYYGNQYPFTELTDDEIQKAYADANDGIGAYFGRDAIEAKLSGKELDAEAIQAYFMENTK